MNKNLREEQKKEGPIQSHLFLVVSNSLEEEENRSIQSFEKIGS